MGFDLDAFTESGKIVKMEIDYTDQVNEALAKWERTIKEAPNKLNEAIEALSNLEKQTRSAADMHSTSRLLVGICQLAFDAKQWSTLNEQIHLLTKRRGQFKQAVTAMVQKCCEFVEFLSTKCPEEEINLLTTLRTVTAGKIYVEVERARLTYRLARIKESEGNVEEACKVMQDTQVETLGSMDRKEKTRLILEQIRYCLATKDFIRAQIISKKISTKFFDSADDPELQQSKLKFYQLMIEIDQHNSKYLDICRHYQAVFQTQSIKEDPARRQEALKNVVLYVILAPYDNEQSDLIHRISQERGLDEIPEYKKLLKAFTTPELISWNFVASQYEVLLKQGTATCLATGVFQPNTEEGEKRWKDFKSRIVEHNIRMMAKYYKRIRLERMSQLLDLSTNEAEDVLSYMVVNKTIWAKVDRLEGIVNFSAQKHPNETLNDWSRNLDTLMNLVGKTNHLINKEEMNYLSRIDKTNIRAVQD
uniref:26S proteasome non-ATPase regulatory subunit 12 n=1 Tax=Aceria tosichella TaxID=561515 RepID=A0A6G1SQC5_9ACAR